MTLKAKIAIKKLTADAKLPAYSRSGDACMDCYADKEVVIPKLTLENGVGRALVPLGFALELPKGWEALVRSRSGLALKEGVVVLNSPGTVDENYRGEVAAIMGNTSGKDYVVKKGDRICQLAIRPILGVDLDMKDCLHSFTDNSFEVEWDEKEELDETNRGAEGFGSSGKN